MSRTIGIDVGGAKKGFHLMALEGNKIHGSLRTQDPAQALAWCLEFGAEVVAVDAPCKWRPASGKREAEIQLYRRGISCYWTPTQEIAQSHPTDFYGWMKNGMALYEVLRSAFPLIETPCMQSERCCFETFPYAISRVLGGWEADKKSSRGAILSRLGIHDPALNQVDNIDAALCALCALLHTEGKTEALGDSAGGWIVIPRPLTSDTNPGPQT